MVTSSGFPEAATDSELIQSEYTRITEVNISLLGQPIRLRSGANPNRFVHPVPLKPLGVNEEAGRLLLRVVGYAGDYGSRSFATTVDVAFLAGVRVTEIPVAGLVAGIHYDKQGLGVEAVERLFKPKDIYYGVHEGHMGKPEEGIAPENPGFYIAGEQFTAAGEPQGLRTFPLGRIAGLMGDPADPAFRQALGLY